MKYIVSLNLDYVQKQMIVHMLSLHGKEVQTSDNTQKMQFTLHIQ